MKRVVWAFSLIICGLYLSACSHTEATPTISNANNLSPQLTQVSTPNPENIPGAAPDFKSQSWINTSWVAGIHDQQFLSVIKGWFRNFIPNQGGIILIGILITILLVFNFKKLVSSHNLDSILLLLPAFFLIDLVLLGSSLDNPANRALFAILFFGLFVSTLVLLILSLVKTYKSKVFESSPNLSTPVLIGLAVILLALNIFQALAHPPDDAGIFSNLGAYQMIKTGKFPYNDPTLRGGAAATYGPILYLAHIPYQIILSPIINSFDPGGNSIIRQFLVSAYNPQYVGPPVIATKLVSITFQILAVICLVIIGMQLAGPATGLTLACLYMSSPYILGLGGETWSITGMTYVSHIVPVALVLLAFTQLKKPILAGFLLALAAGTLYYPVFFFPAWLGYYFWRKEGWQKFGASFIVTCAVIFGVVLLFTQSDPSQSAFQAIFQSTVGHQEASNAYGSSTFSFWSTQPFLAGLWQKQLIEGWYLLRPSVIIFAGFIIASFFMSRRRTLTQFSLLTAAVAIAVQLWKSHAGGSYVEWYYPFLLIGFFTNPLLSVIDSSVTLEQSGAPSS